MRSHLCRPVSSETLPRPKYQNESREPRIDIVRRLLSSQIVTQYLSNMPDHGTEPRPDADDSLEEETDAHLAEVPDGCGCAEVWEHLSGQRE